VKSPRVLTERFGSNIRRLRLSKNLTQEDLAEKASLDPTYISGIERGVRNPTLVSICRLASSLEVSVSRLADGL
jgi:transcriptional regulator with XRE-family HTH domain